MKTFKGFIAEAEQEKDPYAYTDPEGNPQTHNPWKLYPDPVKPSTGPNQKYRKHDWMPKQEYGLSYSPTEYEMGRPELTPFRRALERSIPPSSMPSRSRSIGPNSIEQVSKKETAAVTSEYDKLIQAGGGEKATGLKGLKDTTPSSRAAKGRSADLLTKPWSMGSGLVQSNQEQPFEVFTAPERDSHGRIIPQSLLRGKREAMDALLKRIQKPFPQIPNPFAPGAGRWIPMPPGVPWIRNPLTLKKRRSYYH